MLPAGDPALFALGQFGLGVAALGLGQPGQLVDGDRGMVGAERLLPDRQRALEEHRTPL